MKSGKKLLYINIFALLLIFCSIVFSPNVVYADGVDTQIENLYIEWAVDSEKLTADGGKYTKVFDGENALDAITAYYYIGEYVEGATVKTDIDRSNYVITMSEDSVTEMINVGIYTIAVSDTYQSYLNSASQYNIVANTLTIDITQQMLDVIWDIDDAITEYSGSYSIEYTGRDVKEYISVSNSNVAIDIAITKGGETVTAVKDVGEYTFTASTTDTNYVLDNTAITLNVTKVTKAIVWEVGGNVVDESEIVLDYALGRNNAFVKAYYELGGEKKYISGLQITKGGNNAVIGNVGKYSIKVAVDMYDSGNVLLSGAKEISLDIQPKTIYVVADSFSDDYNMDIPSALGYKIYSAYNVDGRENELLEIQWANTLTFDVAYDGYSTLEEAVAGIDAIRDEWRYDGVTRTKTFGISVAGSNGMDYSNYSIHYVAGQLQINLADITATFRLDGSEENQITKTYLQTQKINAADIAEAETIFGTLTDRDLSGWYNGENLADFDQILTSNTVLSKYSIYYIYYIDKEEEPTDWSDVYVLAKVPFHVRDQKTFPDASVYNANSPYLYKFDYVHNGWTQGDPQKVISIKNTMNEKAGRDIVLCPHFKPIEHKIKVSVMYKDDNADVVIREYSQAFTIIDYNNEKEFTLSASEMEGYSFLGFYYVSQIKDEDGNVISSKENKLQKTTFTLDELFKVENICDFVIRARYEEYKCTITLVVGDKTITSVSQEPGSAINRDYFYNLIDKKFGFIYVMNNVPSTAVGSAVVIRVTEIPLLWIVLAVAVVGAIVLWIVLSSIKKRKNDIDKHQLNVILNKLDDNDISE